MMIRPTPSGGRVAEGDTPLGRYRVEWDADSRLISERLELREPDPMATAAGRPVAQVPDGFDPTQDKGGCGCDPPRESA